MSINLVALGALGASLAAVFLPMILSWKQYLRKRRVSSIRIQLGAETIEIDLKKPEEAELFIKDFLSRHPAEDVGAKE